MRLHYSYASPYVRKVVAVAIETGQRERLELTARKVSPIAPDAEVNRDNPLGKVPCLVTDDGLSLFDSRVICEYLDSLHGGPKMFPAGGSLRWTALRRQAEGDGILDAGCSPATRPSFGPRRCAGRTGSRARRRSYAARSMASKARPGASALPSTSAPHIGCALG